MYTYFDFEFTSKEVDQIVDLAKRWGRGQLQPIDRRRYTPNVQRWAQRVNLLGWGANFRSRGQYHSYRPDRLYLIDQVDYQLDVPRFEWYQFPVEVLWRLVSPMIGDGVGYSITANPGWSDLGIYHRNGRKGGSGWKRNPYGLTSQERVLSELDMHHYITFRQAGSVWEVRPHPEDALPDRRHKLQGQP